MVNEVSLIPQLLKRRGAKSIENILSIFFGIIFLSLLAQISFQIPGTPVPITGQTFGVTLISLIWGRKRGLMCVISYLGGGAIGLPIFASGKSGLILGPTTGYLIGMAFSSYWIGMWADMIGTKKFWQTYFISISGSCIVFICGLSVLSFFIPTKELLDLGVYPFLLGDFIKSFIASLIASQTQATLDKKNKIQL